MKLELPDVQAGFRTGRGTREQIVIEKARKFQKNIYSCFIDYTKVFDCMDHNKLWKILKEMKYQTISPASWETCEAGQEATVRAGHGTTDWFQTGKGVRQGYIFSPCYLTYMQSTSCGILSWMNHNLESRLPGEISTSDMQWHPTPVLLPGKSHGWRSLVGCSPWGH